jgi:hypothetical protein
MAQPGRKSEVLKALGKLTRGLSALFWGLPLAMLFNVQAARGDWMDAMGAFAMMPPLAAGALLVYGLRQMVEFQPQERVWQTALDRALFLGCANLGLAPFLFWWHRMPFVPLYSVAVSFLAVGNLLFLVSLNGLLHRLTAMLPDESLRQETRLFAGLNRTLLGFVVATLLIYLVLSPWRGLPPWVALILARVESAGLWILLFLILMPLAMTMSLVWKIKEVIFSSVFEGEH